MKNTAPFLAAAAALLLGPLAGCSAVADRTDAPASETAAPLADESLVLIGVNGLICNFCATNIDKTLEKTPGVRAVYVNLAAKSVLLRVDPARAPDDEALRAIVTDAGFETRAIRRFTGDFRAERLRLKDAAAND